MVNQILVELWTISGALVNLCHGLQGRSFVLKVILNERKCSAERGCSFRTKLYFLSLTLYQTPSLLENVVVNL